MKGNITTIPPVVALSAYGNSDGGPYRIAPEYVEAVCRAGGLPVLFPPQCPHPEILVDRVDALILTGGGDIDPRYYGSEADSTLHGVHPERDEAEIRLARSALALGIPMLGICRGLQILNVALGGTLHMDLLRVYGEQVRHRAPPRNPVPHAIRLEEGSRMARILGLRRAVISSWHHQAIDRLAPGLVATAFADDGVIEGVELRGQGDILGVQWHPEMTAAQDPAQQRLFDWIVQRARRRDGNGAKLLGEPATAAIDDGR